MDRLNSAVFSERLKKARTDKKLKQSELAELVGVSVATVSSYERSEFPKTPSLETAYQIARCLGVSLDWLCGEEKEELDYTYFDVQTYLKALVVVLSEMSSSVNYERRVDRQIITIDNKALGEFPQKIVNLLKVYHDNSLDTDNFKVCVKNTIERYSKGTRIIGNKLLDERNAECIENAIMGYIYGDEDTEEAEITHPVSIAYDIFDAYDNPESAEFFFTEKELKKY